MSLFENMTMGAKNEGDRQRAEKLLCKVGLSKKLESLEHGLDTVLTREFDDSGEVLSGGEAQKLAVARALMKKGAAYVFDEPSSALDPISEYELFNTVIDETAGTTTMIISHRLSSAKLADRIIVLRKGRVAIDGTPKEVFASGLLEACGLTLPPVYALCKSLENKGFVFDSAALTEEELAEGVCRQLK